MRSLLKKFGHFWWEHLQGIIWTFLLEHYQWLIQIQEATSWVINIIGKLPVIRCKIQSVPRLTPALFFSVSIIWMHCLNVLCYTMSTIQRKHGVFSFLFSPFFRVPKENAADIFTVNFCTVMKFNSWCIEEIFLIRYKRESQRETECRSVKVHAVQICY